MKDINELMREFKIGFEYKQKFLQRLKKNNIDLVDNCFITNNDYEYIKQQSKKLINLSDMVRSYLIQKAEGETAARNSFMILEEIKKRNKNITLTAHDTFTEYKKPKDIYIDKKYKKKFHTLIQIYFSAFNCFVKEDKKSIKQLCNDNKLELSDVLNEILWGKIPYEIIHDYAFVMNLGISNRIKIKEMLAYTFKKVDLKRYKEELRESFEIQALLDKNTIFLEKDGAYYVSKENISSVIDIISNELEKIRGKEFNITINAANKLTGVTSKILKERLEAGILYGQKRGDNWYIRKDIIRKILVQKEKYTSLNRIVADIEVETKSLFSNKRKRDNSELIVFLEQEEFFNVSYIGSNEVLFESAKQGDYYILKSDVDYLKREMNDFILLFGLDSYHKFLKIDSIENVNTVKTVAYFKQYKKKYLDIKVNNNAGYYLPSLNIIYYMLKVKLPKELFFLTDEEIGAFVQCDLLYSKSKMILCGFLQYLKGKTKTKYKDGFTKIINESNKGKFIQDAYSYDKFIDFASCIFNENYIRDHQMIKKALDNPYFAEMWLYHSVHYCCGWRSGDIISNWRYLDFKNKRDFDCIFKDTDSKELYKYIIENKIPDRDYEKITDKVLAEIEINPEYASKTSEYCAPSLEMKILPSSKKHFGLLTLIAEVHHLKNGKGYMSKSSASYYKNRIFMKDFYGDEVSSIFKGENLHSRSLNKSYLQGLEEVARCKGWGGMVAYQIASYARNHISDVYHKSKSTCYYLEDGRFTEKDAKDIIRMLFDCEVFSFMPFQLLMECFPDACLTNEDQIKLIKHLGLDAMEIEISVRAYNRIQTLKEATIRYDSEKMLKLVTALHNIGNGYGTARSKGCFCLRRAVGEVCDESNRKHCPGCKKCIITSKALPAIIQVAYLYKNQYTQSGNKKYMVIYNNFIYPAIKETISAFSKKLNDTEAKEFYMIVGEINREYDKRSKITG